MEKILIVEDDKNIADLLELALKEEGRNIVIEHNGLKGLSLALDGSFSLAILDWMLPEMNGIQVCRAIREKSSLPIMMLTAKAEEDDKILGLELGADDYLTKPFSVKELQARVKALLRRANKQELSSKTKTLVFADLEIDEEERSARLKAKRLDLSPKEFELLLLMSRHPGKTYTRQELLDLVWGYQFDGLEHTVNATINRLRAKIEEDMAHPKFILTTWGMGYRFNNEW